MSFVGALEEVLAAADAFRGHAAEWFGPLGDTVTLSAQIFAAVLALLLIGAGRKLFAPPGTGLADFAPRIAGLTAMVGVVLLFIASRDAESTLSFLHVAVWTAIVLLVSAILYFIAYQMLTFRCTGEEKTLFVRGFRLHPDAKRVLANDQGPPPLPEIRRITGDIRPLDACDYFCKADRSKPEFVWTRGSHMAAQLLLTVLYIPLAASIIVLLAAAAFAVAEVDTKVIDAPSATIVQLPADVLFEFNKSTLKPDAGQALDQIAKTVRDHWKSGSVIVAGYTDGIGDDAFNMQLSKARASSVAEWLATTGKLPQVPYDIQGHGKQDPAASNSLPDGSDNPDGRRLNRRVVVSIPKTGDAGQTSGNQSIPVKPHNVTG